MVLEMQVRQSVRHGFRADDYRRDLYRARRDLQFYTKAVEIGDSCDELVHTYIMGGSDVANPYLRN